MIQIRLFVPAHGERIASGHAYDRRMLAALRDAGHDALALPVDGDAAALWAQMPSDAVPVIDAQTLAPFRPLSDELCKRHAVVLVHHPTALEPGLSEAAHQDLRDAEAAMLPVMSRLIVASEAVAARLNEAFSVPYARIAIVPPGVDDAPRATGSGGPRCRILSIGALVPRKGHDVLLRALARLWDLDWELTIVGTAHRHSAHARALRDLAAEPALAGRVRFIEPVGDVALEELWRHCDLFALATHWESSPGPTADALRRGVPVAVCAGGAAAALVTPQLGSVVPPGDAELLSKVLRRMIFDQAVRAELAEAAWQVGTALPSWQTQAELFVTALA